MRTNQFGAFGLIIDSEIPLPELIPYGGGNAPDVRIRLGAIPTHLEEPSLTGVLFEVKGNQFLLRIVGVGAYLAENGSNITIDPVPGCDAQEIRVFLFTSVFGALLHQRGCLPLHASSVVKEDQAFAFAGPSGVGKSTLAAALEQRGYHLIADDITVINLDRIEQPAVVPGYPRLKLWKDVINHLGFEHGEPTRLRQTMEKYSIPSQGFHDQPFPLKAVYCMEIGNNQGHASLQPIKGCDKLSSLTRNTYRVRFLKGMDIGNRHFTQANALARSVRMVSLWRTKDLTQLQGLLDLLEEDFHS